MDAVADGFARSCRDAARGLRRMPADLRRELGTAVSEEVAGPLARDVAAARFRAQPFGPHVDVRVRKAAEPTLVIGGRRSTVSGGASGAQLFYGTEWGGSRARHQPAHRPYSRVSSGGVRHTVWRNTTAQFVPPRPFVFPTFRRDFAKVTDAWLGVLDPFLDAWEAGGA
jgi:hypothetical protein